MTQNLSEQSILSSLECTLSAISKSTGSATLKFNETICTCVLHGPNEVRQQQDPTSRVQLDVTFQARPGNSMQKDKLIEHWLETLIESTLLVEYYPRSQLNVVIYEEQNLARESTILACLCNTLCLSMLDGNLPMKYAFAAVPIVHHPVKGLLVLPNSKEEIASKTSFVLVFEITSIDVLAMHATGEFSFELLDEAILQGKSAARQIFQFYRQQLEKRLTKNQ